MLTSPPTLPQRENYPSYAEQAAVLLQTLDGEPGQLLARILQAAGCTAGEGSARDITSAAIFAYARAALDAVISEVDAAGGGGRARPPGTLRSDARSFIMAVNRGGLLSLRVFLMRYGVPPAQILGADQRALAPDHEIDLLAVRLDRAQPLIGRLRRLQRLPQLAAVGQSRAATAPGGALRARIMQLARAFQQAPGAWSLGDPPPGLELLRRGPIVDVLYTLAGGDAITLIAEAEKRQRKDK